MTEPTYDALRNQPFTYPEVGATRGPLPDGYHRVRAQRVVGHGQADFERAAAAVLRWEVQRRSGIRVDPSDPVVAPDSVAVLRLGPGPFALTAPARVVYVVEESERRGFAYGTLPGHPARGEEAFVVALRPDGSVVMSVTAFSRPASALLRIAGPLGRLGQHLVTQRYLRALAD